jgi:hypothetical protein
VSKHLTATGSSLSLVLLCAMSIMASPRPANTVSVSRAIPMPFNLVRGNFAEWTGGNLVVITDRWSASPTLTTFDRDGNQTSTFRFTIPGADQVNLYDNSVALAKDGSLAIIGTVDLNDSGGATFVAWVSADRRHQTVIRSTSFFPESVAMPSDGTIWVSGCKRRTEPGEQLGNDHQLILRYNTSGKFLGSISPLLNVPDTNVVGRPPSILVSWGDGVGWYYPREHAYVEFSLDGSVAHRFNGPQNPLGVFTLAACPNGNVFAASKKGTDWGIFSLNREQGGWTFAPGQAKWGEILGCDGTSLVSISDFDRISWLTTAGN